VALRYTVAITGVTSQNIVIWTYAVSWAGKLA